MTDIVSKARQRAESAFDKTQSQSLARNRIISEQDAVAQARDEKTARLRQLRKEKEAANAAGQSISKGSAKTR